MWYYSREVLSYDIFNTEDVERLYFLLVLHAKVTFEGERKTRSVKERSGRDSAQARGGADRLDDGGEGLGW